MSVRYGQVRTAVRTRPQRYGHPQDQYPLSVPQCGQPTDTSTDTGCRDGGAFRAPASIAPALPADSPRYTALRESVPCPRPALPGLDSLTAGWCHGLRRRTGLLVQREPERPHPARAFSGRVHRVSTGPARPRPLRGKAKEGGHDMQRTGNACTRRMYPRFSLTVPACHRGANG